MMKTKVLKGFAALLVLLGVCFFFSGTVRMLTTAKVMLTYPRMGWLTETLSLTGILTFSETEDVTLVLPEETSLTVTKVHVVPGMAVKSGDVLLETRFTGVSALIEEQEQHYAAAQTELLALEREHSTFRLQRTDEAWLSAYDALAVAYDQLHDADVALSVAMNLHSNVNEAQAVRDAAQQEATVALSAMDKAERLGIAEEAYNYTMERRKLEAQMKEATTEIVILQTLEQSTRKIIAAHDGYVISVNAAVGQSWDGVTPALILSAEEAELLLTVDASAISRNVSVGASVTVSGRFGTSVKATVTDTGYDSWGNPVVTVALSAKDAVALDTMSYLMNQGAAMQISYTAAQTSYLLPASAVRGSGRSRSVYAVKESQNAFGQTVLTVEEQKVTVLDEAGDMVSVNGIYDNVLVAYMEDRSIAPGSEVMPYE